MFYRHPVYLITHLLIGFASYYYIKLLYIAITYQLLQYVLNIRFFIFDLEIKNGNSIEHTTTKICELLAGYVLALLVKKIRV
jgi:hypothetical protein